MNNLGILFKEIHNNILFNTYCKDLTLENQIEIKEKILNDSNIINVLLNIVDDIEIIKNKIELIIDQKVRKIPTNPQILLPISEDIENKITKVLFYYQKTKIFRVISCV